MSGESSDVGAPDNAQDLTIFVQTLLEQMVIFDISVCVRSNRPIRSDMYRTGINTL